MQDTELEQINSYLIRELTDKRRSHTYRVAEEAVSLAKQYGVDPKKAEIAGLCHDLARNKSQQELDEWILRLQLDFSLLGNRDLSHGFVAGALLPQLFGITDEEIINAVTYHTTGRRGMSQLEKILYLADAIEPGRQYPGVEELRILAYQNLNQACFIALQQAASYVKKKETPLDQRTIEAIDDLEQKGNNMGNKELAIKIAQILSDKKAMDLLVIDIAEKSSFTDYLVIANGGSERQIGTLTDEVINQLAAEGIHAKNIEGKKNSGWILLDYGDILVNLFTLEQRTRYNLEKIWGDGIFLEIE